MHLLCEFKHRAIGKIEWESPPNILVTRNPNWLRKGKGWTQPCRVGWTDVPTRKNKRLVAERELLTFCMQMKANQKKWTAEGEEGYLERGCCLWWLVVAAAVAEAAWMCGLPPVRSGGGEARRQLLWFFLLPRVCCLCQQRPPLSAVAALLTAHSAGGNRGNGGAAWSGLLSMTGRTVAAGGDDDGDGAAPAASNGGERDAQMHRLLPFFFPSVAANLAEEEDGRRLRKNDGGVGNAGDGGGAGVAPAVDAVSKLREQKWWLVRKVVFFSVQRPGGEVRHTCSSAGHGSPVSPLMRGYGCADVGMGHAGFLSKWVGERKRKE
ncbi:hypothetical protein NC653_028574 [Populus alba x Populus x berolinensis]|uniref:Uncharacterized protein n=2 Tax=Populus TaxID=3689 RepID=A0AAD6Q496_9ROSI|nr:hypothetical protein NC653_028574 [Populus alba x Populus x berolinensis]